MEQSQCLRNSLLYICCTDFSTESYSSPQGFSGHFCCLWTKHSWWTDALKRISVWTTHCCYKSRTPKQTITNQHQAIVRNEPAYLQSQVSAPTTKFVKPGSQWIIIIIIQVLYSTHPFCPDASQYPTRDKSLMDQLQRNKFGTYMAWMACILFISGLLLYIQKLFPAFLMWKGTTWFPFCFQHV